jgi:hypothetical protein
MHVILIGIDHEILSTVICTGMYGSYQFLPKVKATSTGKLPDSLLEETILWLNCSLVNS